jgi:hypothetical protein
MAKKQIIPRYVQPYRYASPNIPLAAIRRFARRIAERFHPDKIILFGSYAYGKPPENSRGDKTAIELFQHFCAGIKGGGLEVMKLA